MASPLPSYASSASMSRSKAPRDDMRSLADEMLRVSLTGSVSSVSTASAAPPSYRSERAAAPAHSTLAPSPLVGSDSLKKNRQSGSVARHLPMVGLASPSATATPGLSRESGIISSASAGMTAAEAKLRVRQLQRKVDRAYAESPRRATAGLFAAACSTDLLFLMDITGSMDPYIDAAKKQIRSIVDDIKVAFLGLSEVRVAVVGYKDHSDTPNIHFCDFTPSTDKVSHFLDTLSANGGADIPEDVLGGVRRALNASWKHQTRCIVHIADAPPHGQPLHDLRKAQDDYFKPGSEPHGLTYKPLLMQLTQLNINYALLRINSFTDRMALAFSRVYTAAGATTKLLESNTYYAQVSGPHPEAGSSLRVTVSTGRGAKPQFEEMQLGTTYSKLRHLVVKTVTGSVSRTATRLSMALSSPSKASTAVGAGERMSTIFTSILEDKGSNKGVGDVCLETDRPKWNSSGWLDETLLVEGFCPDVVLHNASTLNDMMEADANIKLSVAELTIYARSRPFAKGAIRVASYARTAASTNRYVVKSFIKDGKGIAHLAEDMRIQALCKAFALEFNGLLKTKHPIDFVVSTCLQSKLETASENGCLSLEPFIKGDYVKYNSNGPWVREDSPDDHVNRTAQAFSHFTFERSWGHFLVSDLQGVGHLLTDPSIQTRDPERFKLNDTNLNEEGFKFFFVNHECNDICRKLELKSNREMVISGDYTFRELWPTMDPTVCCSNKLCRQIIRLASAYSSDAFPGYHWCKTCWPQLQSSTVRWLCVAPGPNHEFDVSRFFHESQAQLPPRKCPEHREKDRTISSAAVVGGSLWNRMKSADQTSYISGRGW